MTQCHCDKFEHPPKLLIPAGLSNIPRQIAGFSEFRRAMLAAIRRFPALHTWRARGDDDFGIMLLEMWAYVADVQSFYDEVIAHETYVRTARQRSSLRKLVGLLGYVPRPAVAAAVELAILAQDRQPVTIPKGSVFRSGAFGDEAPQVFELSSDTTVHPLNNQWRIAAPRRGMIGRSPVDSHFSSLLLDPSGVTAKDGDVVLIRHARGDGAGQVRTVHSVEGIEGADGGQYIEITLDSAINLPWDTLTDEVELTSPTQSSNLWTLKLRQDEPAINGLPTKKNWIGGVYALQLEEKEERYEEVFPQSTKKTELYLDGIYRQIRPNTPILVSREDQYRAFLVSEVTEVRYTAATDPSEVTIPITRIKLDDDINSIQSKLSGGGNRIDENWCDNHAGEITVHYGLVRVGTVTVEADTTLSSISPLTRKYIINRNSKIKTWFKSPFIRGKVSSLMEDAELNKPLSGDLGLDLEGTTEKPFPEIHPNRFHLEDKDKRGVRAKGRLEFDKNRLILDADTQWDPDLTLPVTAYGNIAVATRGETVKGEILGSGDASAPNQSFKLKKKPLTYLPSPTVDNESGLASTLEVYVEGIRWQDVPSFFNKKMDDQIYIVRQNDDGESIVTFGDGKCGARLPTGKNNIIANYRHGGGAASPPPGSITQLGKPVKGIQGVKNPVAATGGDDAESTANLRRYAPGSALILGRAVSIQDMEAIASGIAGVRAAHAEWRWHSTKQRTVVQIWYIGDEGIEKSIIQTLRALSDTTVPIDAIPAKDLKRVLSLDLEINELYLDANVTAAVRDKVMDKETGLLSPERIGIGQPLFRSRIFEAVMAVEGVKTVQDIQWNGQPFTSFARYPGAGKYFDLENGRLLLNIAESTDG